MSSPVSALLSEIRVLDLSQFTPGPFATLLMSDLGADVIKVEPPHGDPQELDGPLDERGTSLWYQIVNRNKRILRLDLKSEWGRTLLDQLIVVCDVLLESYRPGVLERLGYSRGRLEILNPSLVHCALSGWGQNGPYRLRAGHDNNYQASAGILDVSGTAAEPVAANPPIADFAGALAAFGLINAALFRRERTGKGTFIDIGMADAALALIGADIVAAEAPTPFETRRGLGPYSGGWACFQTYATSCGGYITLGSVESRFWVAFCKKVGKSEWISRQHEQRPQNELTKEVQALFSERTRSEWTTLLQEVETCFHEVLELSEIATNPQVVARQILRVGPDGITDVLLPAWIDGSPPAGRVPLQPYDGDTLLREWSM